jgi:hypothetical protein
MPNVPYRRKHFVQHRSAEADEDKSGEDVAKHEIQSNQTDL